MERPPTQYAWNGDVALAYQVTGDGPIDLLYLQGYCSHIDLNWEGATLARFLRELAGASRLIVTDRRGWGCSDRFSPSDVPPLETLTDDLLAVLGAVGSEHAVIFASWDCSLTALLFAATYPDRASALILCDPFVTFAATEETPWMLTAADWEAMCERIRETWGTPPWESWENVTERDWWARYQRSSVAPGALIAEIRRFIATDLRAVVPSVHVPTLILGDSEGRGTEAPENGRYLAARIPGARLVEHPGGDQPYWYARSNGIVEETRSFLSTLLEEESSLGRVLATVLFTDIVGSTKTAAQLGDRAWRDLVERHHAIVRALLARYRGKEVDTAGDGFFATFDGPARGIRCAEAISEAVRPLGIEIRVGLHTGECEVIDGKVGGLGVVIGSRIGSIAEPGEVLVSQTVKDLVAGSGLEFADRGPRELKGVPGEWRVYAVASRQLNRTPG